MDDIKNMNFALGLIDRKMTKTINESLKYVFKGLIKPSFLIRMKHYIMESNEFLMVAREIYDPLGLLPNINTSWSTIMDVCKNIVYIHQYNMSVQLDENEFENETRKGKEYFEKLKGQVLTNIKLRKYGSGVFSERASVGYYPCIYSVIVFVNYLSSKFYEIVQQYSPSEQNAYYHIKIFSDIFRRMCGIFELMSVDCIDSCYGVCRQIVEFCSQYFALKNHQKALDDYFKFVDYQQYHNGHNGEYSEEFLKIYNDKYKNKRKKPSMINYLNYGWMDSLPNMSDDYSYSMKGVISYLKSENKEINADQLLNIYNTCSFLTHGNVVTLNRFLGNIEITFFVYQMVEMVYVELIKMYDISDEYEGVHLFEYCQEQMKDAVDVFNKITSDSKLNEKNIKKFPGY